jgi:hypothetical protein
LALITNTREQKIINTATQELKELLNNNKNDYIQTLLQGLTPTESTDYSLWKATKKIKQVKKPSPPLRPSQETWARSNVEKAHAFAGKILKELPLIGIKYLTLLFNAMVLKGYRSSSS